MEELTIVTAFFDIGRKDFQTFSRTNNQYLEYFETWARMNNYLVVYTEKKFVLPIKEIRKKFGLLSKTKIVEIDDFKKIESGIYNRMQKISTNEMFLNFRYIKNAVSNNALYDYVMLLKYWCLDDAVANGVNTKMVAWLDFGFNHGDKVYINPEEFDFVWSTNLSTDKIHLFSLKKMNDKPIFNIVQFLTDNIMGAPLIVPSHLCGQLWGLMKRSINSLLDVGFIDDDQLLLTMSYKIKPELFEVHISDWFMPLKEYGGEHLTVREKKVKKQTIKDRINMYNYLKTQRQDYLKRVTKFVKEKDNE